ncbi:MAG TPA: hypothetical protein VG537_04600, partial [Candidatus Kapabacteria bacterium]|nr:hypothetical protein [Candidatus Kapabacteria bacterium]
MKYYFGILLLLASLTFVSGLRAQSSAQYRWHIVLPSRVDSVYFRGPISISCNCENCIAVEVVFSKTVGDSNVILSSHDGGFSWSVATVGIPQWLSDTMVMYPDVATQTGLYYNVAQQIDSLNAIISDVNKGVVIITHDGWKTWRADSSFKRTPVTHLHFFNAAEGMLQSEGYFWTTLDSGNHWKREDFDAPYAIAIACWSYGASMFRVLMNPDTILTTHNNWNSSDTTYIAQNGPLADTSFHSTYYAFGGGDTIVIEGWRWGGIMDYHMSSAIAFSSDLGAHWKELGVPRNNNILLNPSLFDWRHMVITGRDSLGRILQSFDGGSQWECDTVPLSNGTPYSFISPLAVTGVGRVLAGVLVSTGSSLAYLEKITNFEPLVVVPDTIDFGSICKDNSSLPQGAVIEIDNSDSVQTYWLHLAAWKPANGGAFSLSPDSAWVAINPNGTTGSSYNIQVNFNRLPDTTTMLGVHTDTIRMPYYTLRDTSIAPVGSVEIPCRATITGSILLGSLVDGWIFGSVPIGKTDSTRWAIFNDGESDANIYAVRHELNDSAFSVSPAPPITIPSGGGVWFTFKYTPTEAGSDTDMIDFVYRDCSGADQKYQWPMTGTASLAGVSMS